MGRGRGAGATGCMARLNRDSGAGGAGSVLAVCWEATHEFRAAVHGSLMCLVGSRKLHRRARPRWRASRWSWSRRPCPRRPRPRPTRPAVRPRRARRRPCRPCRRCWISRPSANTWRAAGAPSRRRTRRQWRRWAGEAAGGGLMQQGGLGWRRAPGCCLQAPSEAPAEPLRHRSAPPRPHLPAQRQLAVAAVAACRCWRRWRRAWCTTWAACACAPTLPAGAATAGPAVALAGRATAAAASQLVVWGGR